MWRRNNRYAGDEGSNNTAREAFGAWALALPRLRKPDAPRVSFRAIPADSV
jgi:hypothetical protein